MDLFKNHPLSMPRQEAYIEAIEEIKDIPGLSKLKAVMEKYNLSLVTFDYKLNITTKRIKNFCPEGDKKKI